MEADIHTVQRLAANRQVTEQSPHYAIADGVVSSKAIAKSR
jgi:hypothetical protein